MRASLLFCAALLLVATGAPALRAQSAAYVPVVVDGPALGIYGGVRSGAVSAAFAVDGSGVTRDNACGLYESGRSHGMLGGVFGELPLTPVVALYGGLEMSIQRAELAYECVDPAGTRMPDGSVATAITEFQVASAVDVVSLQIGATLRPLPLPIVFAITPSVSLSTRSTYDAREVIVTPSQASFVEGGQERSVGRGDFAAGDLSLALSGSVWYEAQIARSWSLVPRIGGRLALSDEVRDGGLRSSSLEATLGLLYRFPSSKSAPSPIEAGGVPSR